MNFDFSTDQEQLREQLRRMLEQHCSSSAVRAVLEGAASFDRQLWQQLGELGVLGAAIPERYGGVGAGRLELCVLAEELGRSIAPTPCSSSIFLAAEFLLEAGNEQQKRTWLPAVASGEGIGCFAFAAGAGDVIVERNSITGMKQPVTDGDVADFAIVVARAPSSGDHSPTTSLFLVDLHHAGVSRTTVDTIDPTRSHCRIEFTEVPAEALGDIGQGEQIIATVLDRAAVFTAFEQLGGAERALEMARDYALERMAFGRPIGSFQAIKHMLADMYASTELARSNCYYGAWALASASSDLPLAAATARISATQAYQHCSRNNIQVHGGMGFTWESDCHLHFRRSNLLALLLGSPSHWESLLVQRVDNVREGAST